MDVNFSGMELTDPQTDLVKEYISKLEKANHINVLNINIKEHKKAGDRSRYTTELRAETNTGTKTSEETEWDFNLSLKYAFRKIAKEVRK